MNILEISEGELGFYDRDRDNRHVYWSEASLRAVQAELDGMDRAFKAISESGNADGCVAWIQLHGDRQKELEGIIKSMKTPKFDVVRIRLGGGGEIVMGMDNYGSSCCEIYGDQWWEEGLDWEDGERDPKEDTAAILTGGTLKSIRYLSYGEMKAMVGAKFNYSDEGGCQLVRLEFTKDGEDLVRHYYLYNWHNGYYSHSYVIAWRGLEGIEDHFDKDSF